LTVPTRSRPTGTIRLALRGGEPVLLQLRGRLRGATVAPDPGGDRPPDDCDAVVLLAARPSDSELVRRCLEAGRHTLLVARPWLTASVLDGLAGTASRAGAQLAVLNPDRFLPSRQLIRQQLDAGRLGEPGLVRIHRWVPQGPPDAGPDGGAAAPEARDLDTASWLMGAAPEVVFALQGAGDHLNGRSTLVHLGFPAGGMALIDYADDLPPGDGYRSLSLIGSSGAAYADDHQNAQLLYRGGHPQALGVEEGGREHLALVQAFVDGIEQGQDFTASVAAWRIAMAGADAARESVASRRAVPLGGY
jgi:predicted dehydrogenase